MSDDTEQTTPSEQTLLALATMTCAVAVTILAAVLTCHICIPGTPP